MIQFTKSFKTNDGKIFASIEEAQVYVISSLITQVRGVIEGPVTNEIASHLLANKKTLIDILTTTANSRPRARTTNGGTKNRKRTVITNSDVSVTTDGNTIQA